MRDMDVQIRRVQADEWPELRALRLQALAEAPTAFGSTLAEEQSYSDEIWRERAVGASAGCDRATFVAEINGVWIGSVTGLANQFATENGLPLLVAMFVVASERKQGVGLALVNAVTSWARECGASQLALWLASDNLAAAALYERCNFRYTGVIKPHSHAPGLIEKEMIRKL